MDKIIKLLEAEKYKLELIRNKLRNLLDSVEAEHENTASAIESLEEAIGYLSELN